MPDKKVCTLCNFPKLLTDFNKRKSSKDGRQNVCRECNKKTSNKYYEKNKVKHKRVCAIRRDRIRLESQQYLFSYLSTHVCVDCGECDIRCLEFDHVRGKKITNISTMVKDGFSIEKIKQEITKCEVRCANCHRKRTADVQGWYKSGP